MGNIKGGGWKGVSVFPAAKTLSVLIPNVLPVVTTAVFSNLNGRNKKNRRPAGFFARIFAVQDTFWR